MHHMPKQRTLHPYWIGDRVWVKTLGREGIFSGESGDAAIVTIDGVRHVLPFQHIGLMEEEDDEGGFDENDTIGPRRSFAIADEIDLHIDTLNPRLIHASPVEILAHQRIRLKAYLEVAIRHNKRKIRVIHGRGEGVLRAEVLQVLAGFREVDRIEHESHGGAMTVSLKPAR